MLVSASTFRRRLRSTQGREFLSQACLFGFLPPSPHAFPVGLHSLANEILSDLLEGSCREMNSVVASLAVGSVREGLS